MKTKRLALSSAIVVTLLAPSYTFAGDKSLEQELREARIEGQIIATYALNRHLNPFEFSVEADGSHVILSGTVDESIDKDLAEYVALGVDGVKSVKNQIKVEPNYQPKERSETASNFSSSIQDATITASVKSKLLWNDHTDGLDIKVNTDDGVVTLSGEVQTGATKDLAERIAMNTDDVREVKNQLRVNASNASLADKASNTVADTNETVSDAWITAKVKSSLLYTRNVDGTSINVKTKDGVVTLAGMVDSSSERALAKEVAQGVRGVKMVDIDQLRIDESKQTASR